jgi:hypothetical protein
LEENASLFPAKSHPILTCLATSNHFFYFSPTTAFCCDALHPFYALLPKKLKKRATIFKIPIAILKKLCYNKKNQAGSALKATKGSLLPTRKSMLFAYYEVARVRERPCESVRKQDEVNYEKTIQ